MCEHKRVKSVNCVLSCIDCGEILPADFLIARNGTKQAEKQPAEEKASKSTSKKRAAKKAD